jgi:hypothetical protein
MPKSIYTKELADLISSADPKGLKELHCSVISCIYGGWSVVRPDRRRAIRVFDSKKEAVAFAKKYAIAKSAALLSIHDETGMVKKFIRFSRTD